MQKDVVNAVHIIAAALKQARHITFMDRNGNIIMDEDEEETEDVLKMNLFQWQITTMKKPYTMMMRK